MLLLRHADVDADYKSDLKKELLFFTNVEDVANAQAVSVAQEAKLVAAPVATAKAQPAAAAKRVAKKKADVQKVESVAK